MPNQSRGRGTGHRHQTPDPRTAHGDYPIAVPILVDGTTDDGDRDHVEGRDGETPIMDESLLIRTGRFVEQSSTMVGLDSLSYRATISGATTDTVPAEVLVLNIRALTAAHRIDDAQITLAKLVECRPVPDAEPGVGRGLRDLRYTYLEAMRFEAMRLVPAGQGWQLDEDLFQDALEQVLTKLHTNASAVRSWKAFCFGRLVDVHRHQWGTKAVRAGFELPNSDHTEADREAYERAERDISTDLAVPERDAEGGELSEWGWIVAFARGLFQDADPVLRAVVDDQWLTSAKASSLRALAQQLDIQYDKLYNIHLAAQTRLVAALMAQTDRPINRELLARTLASLPRKRGSKNKRSAAVAEACVPRNTLK